jgi:hypothetical protein
MASIADIIVKKNDGTTNITYTAVVPSSGDGVQAVWKSQSVGNASSHQPEFKLSSKEASNGAKRAMHAVYNYPQIATDTTTTLTTVVNRATFSVDWTLPKDMGQTEINEAVSQFANLLVSSLIVTSAKAGYAPT